MENEKRNLIAEHALLTEGNFMIAVQVEKSFQEIMNRLISKLLNKLEEELTAVLGPEWEMESGFDDNAFEKHWSFVIFKKNWVHAERALYYFGFSPDRTRLGDFYFYANRNTEIIKEPIDTVYCALNEKYKKGRKAYSDWWQYVDQEYINWMSEETLLKLYRQEEMVTYFVEQFVKMKDIIEPIIEGEVRRYIK